MLMKLCRCSSIRSTNITEEIKKAISAKEAELSEALSSTDRQLAEVETSLDKLNFDGASEEQSQHTEDTGNTVKQIEEERNAVELSRKLLEQLLSRAREEAVFKAESEIQSRTTHVTSGSQGKGVPQSAPDITIEDLGSVIQIGISGPIHLPPGTSVEGKSDYSMLTTISTVRATRDSTESIVKCSLPPRSRLHRSSRVARAGPHQMFYTCVPNCACRLRRGRVSQRAGAWFCLAGLTSVKEISTRYRILLSNQRSIARHLGFLGLCRQRSPSRAKLSGDCRPSQDCRSKRSQG